MDMSQYLEIFIEETKEHLQSLNQSLLQVEKKPDDTTILNEIFRVAHTLKGMSGTMGFNKMARLTHHMEDVLHVLRNNKIKVNPGLIDLLFKCLDALENYTNTVIETGNEGTAEYTDIIHDLSDTIKSKEPEALKPVGDLVIHKHDLNIIDKASEMGNNVFQITVKLDTGCVLKSARAFVIFKTIEKYSEIIKSEPKVEDIEDGKFDLEFTVIVISKQDEEIFIKEINSVTEVNEVLIKLIAAKKNMDTRNKAEPVQYAKAATEESAVAIDMETIQAKADLNLKKARTGKTVRVDIDRLDVLMNLVSELIIQKTRLKGLEGIEKTQDYIETVGYLERITTNLHNAVMKVRMVPVETVFNRFPRMIRDISRDLGKEVELSLSGEETEFDRTVVDEIGEPLIHLLRNAIDHGIESTERRKELGKSEAGNIYLRAFQDGNNVVIEVEEDGQGINLEKVKEKAIEKGLIEENTAPSMSKKDVIDLLFKPSFSTTDKVTDISGRGVGLDVVKTKIEALGGIVDVETELGKGSKFIIRLPLTLAIIKALLIMVGTEKYAIQFNSIHQITKISSDDIKIAHKQEVILYKNSVIPIIRLDDVLDIPKVDSKPKFLTLVIVKKGGRLSGLVVDRIIGQQEIVQKSLGEFFTGIKNITSATILGDGNVALILDVNSLVP